MSEDSEVSMPMAAPANQTICSNCHSTMPAELRFCRNCGFRLTSELGGYTATNVSGPIAPSAPGKKKRRLSGMSWIFVGLLVFFVVAAAFTALIAPLRKSANVTTRTPVVRASIGAKFDQTDEGVLLEAVTLPNGPVDKAGLLGGDTILTFDGQKIEKENQLDDLMENIPVGKTIDVEYLRDGEKKVTKLTTISQEEDRKLSREFERRPDRAQFGYEDGDAERVQVPGMKIYGVKLGTILRSRPADIAGVKEGDIVIEWDGVPIRTSDEFLMRVRRALPYSTVKLVVMRGPEGEPPPPPSDRDEVPQHLESTQPQKQTTQFQKLEIPVKLGKQ